MIRTGYLLPEAEVGQEQLAPRVGFAYDPFGNGKWANPRRRRPCV